MRIRYLTILLLLAALNLRPAITSISPLLENIRADLHIQGVTASLLVTLPVLCMGLFAPLALSWSKRWGLEKVITFSLLLIGLATLLRLMADSTVILMSSALLAGIGIGLIGPLLSGFIKQYFPNPAAMVSVYSVSLVIGAALAAGLAVPLQQVLRGSWQYSLSFWAILAIVAGLSWLRLARAPQSKTTTASVSLPFRQQKAWLLTIFFGLMAAIFYSLTTWLSPMMAHAGYSKIQAGYMMTLFTIIQIPISFLIPIGVSTFGKRAWWLVGCSVMEIIGLLALHLPVSPWLAIAILGIGAGGLFPLALMLPIQEAHNAGEANAWSAMTQSGGYTLGAIGPLIVGLLFDHSGSFITAQWGLGVMIVLMIIVQCCIGNGAKDVMKHKPVVATANKSA